jgi:hypothetical protein
MDLRRTMNGFHFHACRRRMERVADKWRRRCERADVIAVQRWWKDIDLFDPMN